MYHWMAFKMSDHQPECARRSENVDGANEQDIGPPAGATITTIYYDCLERIFDFLDLKSLLNVAGTCKRLQIAATAKFGDDFGQKNFRFTKFRGMFLTRSPNDIIVKDSKFFLPLLRCFGPKMKHLAGVGGIFDGPNNLIREYVHEYCADSLISIEFCSAPGKFSILNFSKPFKNVEKVFARGHIDQLSNYFNCFPKLRHLKLYIGDYGDDLWACSAVSFPYLEHLKLYARWIPHLNLLQANPQLKSVSIAASESPVTTEYVFKVLEKNTSLTKLELCDAFTPVEEVDMVRFAEQHPLLAELNLSNTIPAEQAIMFIRHLTALKRFEFVAEDRLECDRVLNQLDSKWQHNVTDYEPGFKIELTC